MGSRSKVSISLGNLAMNLVVLLGVSLLPPLLPALTRTAWRTFWSTLWLSSRTAPCLFWGCSKSRKVYKLVSNSKHLALAPPQSCYKYSRAQCESKVPVTNGLLEFPVQYDPSLDVYCSGKSWLQIESWEVWMDTLLETQCRGKRILLHKEYRQDPLFRQTKHASLVRHPQAPVTWQVDVQTFPDLILNKRIQEAHISECEQAAVLCSFIRSWQPASDSAIACSSRRLRLHVLCTRTSLQPLDRHFTSLVKRFYSTVT